MNLPPLHPLFSLLISIACLSSVENAAAEPVIPPASAMGKAGTEEQRVLLSPLEERSVSHMGAYRMDDLAARPAAGLSPKAGVAALEFFGTATDGGAKGDFAISTSIPAEVRVLGMWVYLEAGANVSQVGFQITDAEGEALMALHGADQAGWRWIESGLADRVFQQAYPQADKNGMVDHPLRNIHLVWFAKDRGATSLAVDALAALTAPAPAEAHYSTEIIAPAWGEPDQPFQASVLIHNFTDEHLSLHGRSLLHTNADYRQPTLPEPLLGLDHAQGMPSWLEISGKRLDDKALTDEDPDSCISQPKTPSGGVEEIFHFLDLRQARPLTAFEAKPGDANWINWIDISTSLDGESYQPVREWQNLNLHKKWGLSKFTLAKPRNARFLRVRYHNGGEPVPAYFRSLSHLHAYDGTADETSAVPAVGEEVSAQPFRATIPPRSFALVPLEPVPAMEPGAYMLGLTARNNGASDISLSDYFVMPTGAVKPKPSSRFGINASQPKYLPHLVRAGFGWVRFENMKWQFYNPNEGDFRFDGSVAPWHVPMDDYFAAYTEAGISVLPYIFQTPEWATSAGGDIKENRPAYAPKQLADYGKAIFQAVARYGSKNVPETQLRTEDKASALNLINHYELWNEPNLTAPGWGFFVGDLKAFYELYQVGAEAVKAADPSATVINGGWAGLSMDWIDTMRAHAYADGTTPLDLTDVLSVHYYTGKQEPELATLDPNAVRGAGATGNAWTLVDDLVALADWRDDNKPGMPIWVTEMGYDVGGPIGRTERHQAAKLPRSIMLSLANGVDKVFIYRESGSTPAHHAGAGLIRNDGSLRPSYFTVSTLIRQLDGVPPSRVPRLMPEGSNAWLYHWTRPDGGSVLTAWAPDGVDATLGVDLGVCLVTDAFGRQTRKRVARDLPLSEFPIYISQITNLAPVEALEEEAAKRERQRQDRRQFAKSARALLFDFGSTEHIGTETIGQVRAFTPILTTNQYTPETGHGFTDVHGNDKSAHWIDSALEKDWVQLHAPSVFRLDLAPGTYQLRLIGTGFDKNAEATVKGLATGGFNIPLPADNDGHSPTPHTLSANKNTTLDIHLPRGNIQWMSLVETPTQ